MEIFFYYKKKNLLPVAYGDCFFCVRNLFVLLVDIQGRIQDFEIGGPNPAWRGGPGHIWPIFATILNNFMKQRGGPFFSPILDPPGLSSNDSDWSERERET